MKSYAQFQQESFVGGRVGQLAARARNVAGKIGQRAAADTKKVAAGVRSAAKGVRKQVLAGNRRDAAARRPNTATIKPKISMARDAGALARNKLTSKPPVDAARKAIDRSVKQGERTQQIKSKIGSTVDKIKTGAVNRARQSAADQKKALSHIKNSPAAAKIRKGVDKAQQTTVKTLANPNVRTGLSMAKGALQGARDAQKSQPLVAYDAPGDGFARGAGRRIAQGAFQGATSNIKRFAKSKEVDSDRLGGRRKTQRGPQLDDRGNPIKDDDPKQPRSGETAGGWAARKLGDLANKKIGRGKWQTNTEPKITGDTIKSKVTGGESLKKSKGTEEPKVNVKDKVDAPQTQLDKAEGGNKNTKKTTSKSTVSTKKMTQAVSNQLGVGKSTTKKKGPKITGDVSEQLSCWREEFIWETGEKYPDKVKQIKPMTGKNTIIINPEDETSKYTRRGF